eukprot:CAMPEP_0174380174 /NCGR_PEP_ID=MMETSP0811_2-20130205/123200_1 /TAXON_ID=73025 ORGANISM="Eutreptiella gymnastica-like, Strain CCMP1594" /NCGR_SAMPLE_ID=MMETSP0811_2 /ASSEMBLY_ACC=CAM_ASM_000667 /LENGTH=119 /DNA_ID=CAMNT_0015532953 /DNA_START=761 /DNA_END=1121 /DNA_ORIENTATION=+
MVMMGSLNSYRGAGWAEATEPPPHFQGRPEPGSGPECILHWSTEATEPPPHFQGRPEQVLAQSAYCTGRGAHKHVPLAQQEQYQGAVTWPEVASVAIRTYPASYLVKWSTTSHPIPTRI